MTREEVIKELKIEFIGEYDKQREAKNLAIKALEQEPCEDCISREAVDTLVDELARAISDERCFISRGRDTATIMQDILDLPSVTPQLKIGGIECDVFDKLRAEIIDWQTDIHDNENDAETHDFVFERIYEILDEYKAESDKEVEENDD